MMRINLQFAKFTKSSNGTAIESFYLLEDCICYQSNGSLNNGGNTTNNGGINGNNNKSLSYSWVNDAVAIGRPVDSPDKDDIRFFYFK